MEIGDRVKIVNGDEMFLGKEGIIIAINKDEYKGKEVYRFLLQGNDLSGAIIKEGEKKVFQEDKRFVYDFMVEKVN